MISVGQHVHESRGIGHPRWWTQQVPKLEAGQSYSFRGIVLSVRMAARQSVGKNIACIPGKVLPTGSSFLSILAFVSV